MSDIFVPFEDIPNYGRSSLNPHYTFDNFDGFSNRIAVAAAHRVATNPGVAHNPLFIYSGIGPGRTHLIQAIGNYFLELHPEQKVQYFTAEHLIDEIKEAVSKNTLPQLREYFGKISLLLIEDFQFIAHDEIVQPEILGLFTSLTQIQRQIVIGCDRSPRALLKINGQLQQLLEAGLITDLQLPDYETRLTILKAKAEHQAISPIPTDVLEFIAHKIQSNIRELKGALTRVVASALHNRTNLSVEQAAMALNDMVQSAKKMVTPTRIVEQVAQFYNLDSKELRGRSRSQNIVLPRQIAMHIIREHTDVSLVEIGQELGNRSSSTIAGAVKKIEREIETNTTLRQQVNTIVRIIYS